MESAPTTVPSPLLHRQNLVLAFALALLALGARIWVLYATHSTTEDFYITLRYAENLAAGHGFVYNAGERVLGTTTPLYTLLLALAATLHLDPLLLGKGLNILADAATCLLLARLLATLGHPKTGWLAALLYATASAPINFSIGGMETGLVTLAGLAAIYLYVTERWKAMWLALAALFLLRIDGLLLAGVLGIGCWVLGVGKPAPTKAGRASPAVSGLRHSPLAPTHDSRLTTHDSFLHGLLLAFLLVLPWLVFAIAYFGSPIPTSLVAKVAVYSRTRPEPLPNLGELAHQFLGGLPQKIQFVLFLVGTVAAWRSHRPLRAPLIWLSLYYGVMLVSRVPAFGWYFVPPLPVYYVMVALGVRCLVFGWRSRESRVESRESDWSTVVGRWPVVGLAVLALALVARLPIIARDIAKAQELEDNVRKPLGLWLRENTAPTERVMLEPIGYIGYFSQRPVLDIIGLVSPEVLQSYRRDVPYPLGDIVTRFRPDVLVLRRTEQNELNAFSQATGRRVLDGEYRRVADFPPGTQHGKDGPTFVIYRIGEEPQRR